MRRGFTLIEMLVTVAIMALLALSVGNSILSFFKAERVASGESYSAAAAQGALGAIVSSVRGMSYGADGEYPIVSMSQNALTFFADNGPGGASQKFTFQITGTSLLESIVTASGNPPAYTGKPVTEDIVDGVQNASLGKPLFQYFDANGNVINDFSKTASTSSLVVTLEVGGNAAQPSWKPYEMTSWVIPRNLRSR